MDNQYSDPLNETVNIDAYFIEKKTIENKLAFIKYYPRLPLFALVGISIIFFVLLSFIPKSSDPLYDLLLLSATTAFMVIGGYGYIKKIENDTIFYLLCQQLGWIYNPHLDNFRGQRFAKRFPASLDRGSNYTVRDQIWGSIDTKRKNAFWLGTFVYSIDANPRSKTYDLQVFILQLNAVLPISLMLYRYGITFIKNEKGHSYARYLMNRDYKTESDIFNKLYKIKILAEKNETKRKLEQILSPSIQVRLIDFAEKYTLDSIAFQDTCMLIVFQKPFLTNKHTNFLRKVAIDNRDVKTFQNEIKEMISLPEEMLKYLD